MAVSYYSYSYYYTQLQPPASPRTPLFLVSYFIILFDDPKARKNGGLSYIATE